MSLDTASGLPAGSLRLAVLSDVNNPHTLRWVRALAERGHQILLFSLSVPNGNYFSDFDNVRLEACGVQSAIVESDQGSVRKIAYLTAVPRLRKVLKAFRPDVVHSHYATSYGLLGLLSGCRPFVVSVWGMDVYDAPRSYLLRLIVRRVLASADEVLSTSLVMRERTLQILNRRIEVVPFGIDVSRFVPARKDSGLLIIGTVKALETKYGIEFLIRAYSLLPRYGVEIGATRLMIVGDGSLRAELEDLARSLGVADYTRFVGRVEYHKVHEYQQRMDIAVFPSIDDSESFGVAVVEAQACGIPAVVCNVGGLPEVVMDGVTGIVVAHSDPESLAAAIARLCNDGASRERLGMAGRERAVTFYSLQSCVQKLEGIFQRVSAGGLND